MLIILIVIIGLSVLILGHEAGHFFVAKAFGLKVDEFGFGFPPRMFAWKRGDTEYSINWLPFGGFVKISGERGEFAVVDGEPEHAPASEEEKKKLFFTQPAWKKSLIILAGIIMNFVLGWLFISAVFMIGVPKALVISGTEPNSPAAQAGIMPGDIVKNFSDAQSFIDYVNSHTGEPIGIAVLRTGKEFDYTITPRTNPPANQGALGVELEEGGAARENVFVALRDGLYDAGLIAWLTLQAFYNLILEIFTHATLPAGVVGPVGIFGIAEETGKIGLAYLLQFLGIISLNLMIVNLIPFPALDGGRFLMIIIEKIRGAAISFKTEAIVNSVGFGLLLLLMVLLTIRDVSGLL